MSPCVETRTQKLRICLNLCHPYAYSVCAQNPFTMALVSSGYSVYSSVVIRLPKRNRPGQPSSDQPALISLQASLRGPQKPLT